MFDGWLLVARHRLGIRERGFGARGLACNFSWLELNIPLQRHILALLPALDERSETAMIDVKIPFSEAYVVLEKSNQEAKPGERVAIT